MIKKMQSGIAFFESGTIITNTFQESLNKAIAYFPASRGFIQMVSLKPLVSLEQAFLALDQALYFHAHKQSISTKLSLEFLVRLTSQRQIKGALDVIELPDKGTFPVLVVIYTLNKKDISKALNFVKKEFKFKSNKKLLSKNLLQNFTYLKKLYSISDQELLVINSKNKFSALQALVLERIALVQVNR